MGFAAVNTGNNLLFLVVSALLAFMAVSGLAGWINIRRLGVSVVFPEEIYEGADAFVTIRLENRKRRLPSFLIRVDVFGGNVRFPLVEKGETESDAITIRFRQRGRMLLERVSVSSNFPINFFVRRRSIPVTSQYVVFPAPRECVFSGETGRKDERGESFSSRSGYGGDLAKIRDYTGSEPLKLIHWRLSARHEVLKVKEHTTPAETPLIIDIMALPGGTIEENLSCGVYLVNKAVKAGRPVGLKLGSRTVKPDLSRMHRLHLLEELAVYGTH